MKNEELLFERNYEYSFVPKIKRQLKLSRDKQLIYKIKTKIFSGDHILEILSIISYIKATYNQKVPLIIHVSECEFYDKLVYIILESLVYYLYKDLKYDVKIILEPIYSIYTEGMKDSPLRNMVDPSRYIHEFAKKIGRMHYRKLVPERVKQKPDCLSNIMQEIEAFLVNTGIDRNVAQQMKEVLIELIGNAGEHGNSDCLIDIDITDNVYRKTGNTESDDTYYGMNVVILNYSSTLFYEPLKKKMKNEKDLPDRYGYVRKAEAFHMKHVSENYDENAFYTVSSFQHRISGSYEKNSIGGTGLTSLLQSLEDQADNHLCYMLTGDRIFFFEKDRMKSDNNNFVGFNKEGKYLDGIPDKEIFQKIKTFFPGVAYNLNYAFIKGIE